MSTGRFDKYWKYQGKIITFSSFLSAPKKGYNLCTLGPTVDIREKMVGYESVKISDGAAIC
jgi:hypothetical protein